MVRLSNPDAIREGVMPGKKDENANKNEPPAGKPQGQKQEPIGAPQSQESDPAIPTDRPLSPDDKFTGARQPNETPGI